MVDVVRISKTSAKPWVLYGPVDQALKTSIQAGAVKVVPLSLQDVHGKDFELELWINAKEREYSNEEPNPAAICIIQQQLLRDQNMSLAEVALLGAEPDFEELPDVKGVAILTGAGCSDFPGEDHRECILLALMGSHSTLEEEDVE